VSSHNFNDFERNLKRQIEDIANKHIQEVAADARRNPRKYVKDQTPWLPDPVTGEVPPEPVVTVTAPKFRLD
jgi:hypothetical protein